MKALSILVWLVTLWVSAEASGQKNFRDYPVVLETDGIPWSFEMPDRVAAIGDTHSDPDALATTLEHIQFIDYDGEWIAGKSHLVLMGDLVGKGPHSRVNWQLALNLKERARKRGGMVHILMGNHELSIEDGLFAAHMGQDDIWAYNEFAPYLSFNEKMKMSPYDQLLRGVKAMAVAWADPNSPYAREVATRNSILRIGDLVFIHGGLSDYFFGAPVTHIDRVNHTYRELVKAMQKSLLGDKEAMDAFNGMEWLYHSSANGPMWTRELAKKGYPIERFEIMMNVLNSRRLIIGHSPTEKRIVEELYRGRVFNIDTGVSRAISRGHLSAMVFFKGGRHEIYNKISRRTYHPVAQAIRTKFRTRYEFDPLAKNWSCFAHVALRGDVLSAFVQ